MFENITKGVWSIDQQKVKVNKYRTTVFPLRIDTEPMCFTNVARIYEPEANMQNAEFIVYCFNLQQRFDVSKLEEAVKALENSKQVIESLISSKRIVNLDEALAYYQQILTQIKK